MSKPKARNILLTGVPGVGKTTLITTLASRLAHLHPTGFYTQEIRERGARKGFELVDFAGRRMILSHVDITGNLRVSKYGVDIAGFESFLDGLELSNPTNKIIIIDEIGKMECLSSRFRSLIVDLLDSPTLLLATIALKGAGVIDDIKRRPDVQSIEITPRNRDKLSTDIIEVLT